MKKKWGMIAVVALVLALIAAAVIVHFWFESAGINVLGDDIHAELSGKCYLIDPGTGEVIDETSVYINGSTSYSDETLFDGELNVVGYQNTASGTISSTVGVERGEQGYWLLHHLQSCTHRETVDGITKDQEHLCNYQYIYYLKPDLDDQVIVRIESLEDDPLYAVRADTEEEALGRYADFMEDHP